MASRPITADEIGYAAEVVELAFRDDPIWSVALRTPDGRTDHHAGWWRPAIEGPFRYGTARISEDRGAVAIWLPPGGIENTPEQVAELEALARRVLTPTSAAAMHELVERFEAARAPRPPHYYLSLLATHPDFRGRGIAQRLVADDLAPVGRRRGPGLPGFHQPGQRPSLPPAGVRDRRRVHAPRSMVPSSARCGGRSGALSPPDRGDQAPSSSRHRTRDSHASKRSTVQPRSRTKRWKTSSVARTHRTSAASSRVDAVPERRLRPVPSRWTARPCRADWRTAHSRRSRHPRSPGGRPRRVRRCAPRTSS